MILVTLILSMHGNVHINYTCSISYMDNLSHVKDINKLITCMLIATITKVNFF